MKLFLQKQRLPKPQGVTMAALNKLISIKEMKPPARGFTSEHY
jgi:hypothetical protein